MKLLTLRKHLISACYIFSNSFPLRDNKIYEQDLDDSK